MRWLSPEDTVKQYSTGWAMESDVYKGVQTAAPTLPNGVYSMYLDSYGKPCFSPVKFPSDSPVALPGLPVDYILNQIKTFWTLKDKYRQFGFLQKRGIMMYGPPGCGKTSIIRLLCDEMMKINGIVFTITDFGSAISCLSKFREIESERPVLTLMEDVEGIFAGDAGPRQIQHALSLLDGQDQLNNVVHIATTNKPEELADRFIKRPGRFDIVIGIHAPSIETRRGYLKHVSQDQISEEVIEKLAADTEGLGLSYLRELVSSNVCLGVPLDETLERLKKNFQGTLRNKNTGFTLGFKTDREA